jgi:hypothetical protein
MAGAVVEAAKAVRFPATAEPSEAIVPVMVGGPQSWMKR